MADVFISYAKKDRAYAEELAKFLDELGVTTWWDANLVGGEEFRERITKEIDESKATIVIWSATSIKSSFVIDEADYARKSGKLLSAVVPGFKLERIPLGFRVSQAISIGAGDQIIQALMTAGIGDVRRTGGYLLRMFATQITAIERNTRRTRQFMLAGLLTVLLATAGLVVGGWLFRPASPQMVIYSFFGKDADTISANTSVTLNYPGIGLAPPGIAKLYDPDYTLREISVSLYDMASHRLAVVSEAKNVRVSLGGVGIMARASLNLPVPQDQSREFVAVTCASLSKGKGEASIRVGKVERVLDHPVRPNPITGKAYLSGDMDISDAQIMTLQRESGCALSNAMSFALE
jgi:hypothetical protein